MASRGRLPQYATAISSSSRRASASASPAAVRAALPNADHCQAAAAKNRRRVSHRNAAQRQQWEEEATGFPGDPWGSLAAVADHS